MSAERGTRYTIIAASQKAKTHDAFHVSPRENELHADLGTAIGGGRQQRVKSKDVTQPEHVADSEVRRLLRRKSVGVKQRRENHQRLEFD